MNGYFDIHCHILPGIDDGAQNIDEMLKMIKIAYKEGIRYIMATPHYHPRRGEADAEVIRSVFGKARSLIKSTFSDMEIYEGNEIYYRQEAKDMLKNGELLTLAGSDYALLEFSTAVEKQMVTSAVNQLQLAGYMPVIAHVERYDELVDDFCFVQELAEAGVYFQVNASSITGDMGGARKRFIKKMIKNECVHFIGTDAHSSIHRAPLLAKCASYITKKFDADMAELLLYYNPSMIVQNKLI